DLFDWGLDGLTEDDWAYLDEHWPGATSPEYAPELVQDDASTVELDQPADLITSIESIQYFENPLGAIANWYNNLADDGLLIVATEHNLADWIRYDHPLGDEAELPTRDFLEALSSNVIEHAFMYEIDTEAGWRPDPRPDRIRTLVIKKRPDTRIEIVSP